MFSGDFIQSEGVALTPENREFVHALFGEEWSALIGAGKCIVVRLAYVVDPSLTNDANLTFSKCLYVGAAVAEAVAAT